MKSDHLPGILLFLLVTCCFTSCLKNDSDYAIEDFGFIQIRDGEVSLLSDNYGTFVPQSTGMIDKQNLAVDGTRVWFFLYALADADHKAYELAHILPVEVITPEFVANPAEYNTVAINSPVDNLSYTVSGKFVNIVVQYTKNTDGCDNTFSLIASETLSNNSTVTIKLCHNNNGGNGGDIQTSTNLYSIPLDSLPGHSDNKLKGLRFIFRTKTGEHGETYFWK